MKPGVAVLVPSVCEVVVPGPGGETNNDRVPDLEYGVVRDIPDKQMRLRLTNAFSEKFGFVA